jgi:molybdate transport system permease protein
VSWSPLLLSLEVATLAMIVAVVVGTALALLLEWPKLPARYVADAIVSAPLVLPPTVLGYYLVVILGHDSWIGDAWRWLTGTDIVFTFTGAVIAAAVGALPFVVRSVQIARRAIEPSLLAAARTLGAKPRRVVTTIVLPLAAPGIIGGAMLAFARALGDYGMTQMVAGAKFAGLGIDRSPTASIYVMDAMLASRDDDAMAMAIVTTVVGLGLLYTANRLTQRRV